MNNDFVCPCLADKAHSSKTSTSSISNTSYSNNGYSTSSNSNNNNNPSTSPHLNSNNYQQQQHITTNTGSGFGSQTYFGNIMTSMALLQQIPVVPQVPGHPAFYSPENIPKGAIVAFMPVIILPEAAYAKCDENTKQFASEHIKNPLGVQPSSIPFGFNLNSIFSNNQNGKKDQCMCPCSCTQNIPDRLHAKREADTDDLKAEETANTASNVDPKTDEKVAVKATDEK